MVDSLGEEITGKDDRYVTIGQKKPLTGGTVQLWVHDLMMEPVVD
jgi:hypothetical protein